MDMGLGHAVDDNKLPLVIPTALGPLQNNSHPKTSMPLIGRDMTELYKEHKLERNGTNLAYEPLPGEIAAISVIFGILWLFSVFGNALVCLVIHRSRRTQSTTNYFVVSLACADLLISVASAPFVLLQFTSGVCCNPHRI
ncbi:putative G-protein coupled receptor 19 isoform X2 [Sminthopsis crassicaudata]|uniref:putative G-protein coupled receptor 19 isoform X2 n=1 Tax=Sminthopsis crassicaudata TaxID=9301 RepID=UPI003D69BFF6